MHKIRLIAMVAYLALVTATVPSYVLPCWECLVPSALPHPAGLLVYGYMHFLHMLAGHAPCSQLGLEYSLLYAICSESLLH